MKQTFALCAALIGFLWGTSAMAQSGVGKCLWEALPNSKLAALTMPRKDYGGPEGSMINVVGMDSYIAAFERCAVEEKYGDFSGQALDQYVSQLRAERALDGQFTPEALNQAFKHLAEGDIRQAEQLDGDDAERASAAGRVENQFLTNLNAEASPELGEYLRARLSVFTWEVLMPEALEAEMSKYR